VAVVSRRVAPGLPVNTDIANGSLYSFSDPSKPAHYSTWLPSQVKYAGGDPEDIKGVLAHICDKHNLGKTLIILKDLDDPQRPLFLITDPASRFFPRGNWHAYLYTQKRPQYFTDCYRGNVGIAIEPNLIPPWRTWRFLSRLFREQSGISNPRKHRNHEGLIIHYDTLTIVPVRGQGGEHNSLVRTF